MMGQDSKPAFARLQWEGRRDQPRANPAASLSLESRWQGSRAQDRADQLILGDNLAVMQSMLPNWQEKLDLIYADPPFLSGKRYAARIGRNEDSRKPDEWETIQGYTDHWPDGSDYLNMLFPRLLAMYKLLSPHGSLYLHLDWHAAAYARILLDEIFGPDRFLNEIVWVYHGPSPIRSAFKRKHDTILVYTKSKDYTFNADEVRIPYKESTIKTFKSSKKAGFGKKPDLARGKVPEDWWYFPVVARLHNERTGYPTQKPEALLERIMLASSNPGDVVADFFAGSGTTAAVAARLGRRWIACDAAPLAVRTCYRRMLLEQNPRPFEVWVSDAYQPQATPQLQTKLETRGNTVQVSLQDMQGDLGTSFPDCINVWEVDWSYDGQVLRSQSQVARSWKQSEIRLHLQHAYPTPGTYTLATRVLTASGASALSINKVEIGA